MTTEEKEILEEAAPLIASSSDPYRLSELIEKYASIKVEEVKRAHYDYMVTFLKIMPLQTEREERGDPDGLISKELKPLQQRLSELAAILTFPQPETVVQSHNSDNSGEREAPR